MIGVPKSYSRRGRVKTGTDNKPRSQNMNDDKCLPIYGHENFHVSRESNINGTRVPRLHEINSPREFDCTTKEVVAR